MQKPRGFASEHRGFSAQSVPGEQEELNCRCLDEKQTPGARGMAQSSTEGEGCHPQALASSCCEHHHCLDPSYSPPPLNFSASFLVSLDRICCAAPGRCFLDKEKGSSFILGLLRGKTLEVFKLFWQ